MKALLDTHTFLWWNLNDLQLSDVAREFIENGRNQIYFSAVSGWEIAVKYGKGSLILPEPPEKYVANRLIQHHFSTLPIQLSHTLQVHTLPTIHKDPFDRLLITRLWRKWPLNRLFTKEFSGIWQYKPISHSKHEIEVYIA